MKASQYLVEGTGEHDFVEALTCSRKGGDWDAKLGFDSEFLLDANSGLDNDALVGPLL